MYDIVIRNGLVIDGEGGPGRRADVAIAGSRIVAVGEGLGAARREIDAGGRAVAPGFIDPHTHFDAQLLWDGHARPVLEHGVTCVIPGNCSLSLAPLRAADRPAVIGMFQQIEEMPPEAFTERFAKWTWEDFAGYCRAIAPDLGVNVAPLVGHSLIRLWVMGAESQQRPATDAEIADMQALLEVCLADGAIGLSTSFVDMDAEGRPVPSRFADFRELDALSAVLGRAGGRMLQVVPEFYDVDLTIARIDQLAELSLRHGIPTTFSPVFDSKQTPTAAPRILARVEEQTALGARVWPQMQTRPIDISFSLLNPSLFLARLPNWWRLLKRPLPERLAALNDPKVRADLIADCGADGGAAIFGDLIIRGGDSAPAAYAGRRLGEVAAERGEGAAEAVLAISLENSLDVALLAASGGHEDTGRIGPMLASPLVHIGASDGGAHLASFATYGDTGYLFSEFVRRSGHFTLELAVKKITADPADIWGLADRGRLKPGLAADVVIFDPDTIDRDAERPVFDVPGEGMRYTRSAIGVQTVLVNGEVAYEDGAYTAAKAGVICSLEAA
ncbi:MAG: amidohydrolase [Phenylobacterium zucineum]|nr:MAG: amidohydrolase [Phenylobacterium zucineum]